MADNILNRTSYEITDFESDNPESPKIKPGGSSTSNILNRYFSSLSQDLSLFITRTNRLADRADRLQSIDIAQGAGYVGMFNQLTSRVNAVTGLTTVLTDMHTNFYLDSTNSAQVDYKFGQAILPVVNTTDLLVQTNIYGQNQVSNNIEFSYTETASASATPPSNSTFQVDPEGLFMIRRDQSWLHTNTKTAAYVKLKTPVQIHGLSPNVLEIYPLPVGVMDLTGCWYQLTGTSADGTWYAIDLSYLSGYTATYVPAITPVRIILPGVPISQICFGLRMNGITSWGIYGINLYHNEYQSSATLVVKDPYNRTIGNVLLRGKDPSTLSAITNSKSTNKVSFSLTTTDSTVTPVITAAIISI